MCACSEDRAREAKKTGLRRRDAGLRVRPYLGYGVKKKRQIGSPRAWEEIGIGRYDLVIGSRNGQRQHSRSRVALSNLGLTVSRLVSKHDLSDYLVSSRFSRRSDFR